MNEEASDVNKPENVVPAGMDPDESPFTLQAIEGLPFEEDSEEAEAIREVIEQAEAERSDTSGSASR